MQEIRYRSPALQQWFPEDTLFAVREIQNLNSGRNSGLLVVAASRLTWDKASKIGTTKESSIIVDQYGRIVFPFDSFWESDNISSIPSAELISLSESGYFQTKLKQEDYMIYFTEIGGDGLEITFF